MFSAWRYDAETKEVEVPRSYDAAKGRSSKIQACKMCREKKTRCTGDGHNPCDRCVRKQLCCQYAECAVRRKPRQKGSNHGAAKPCAERRSKLSSTAGSRLHEYDSCDTSSDRTASPEEDQLLDFEMVDPLMGVDIEINPLLWQEYGVSVNAQNSQGSAGGGTQSLDVDAASLMDPNYMFDGVSFGHVFQGDEEQSRMLSQGTLDWAPGYHQVYN